MISPAPEPPISERDLSGETRRFLRHFRLAEKLLNEAYSQSHGGGCEPTEPVSAIYHKLYGPR